MTTVRTRRIAAIWAATTCLLLAGAGGCARSVEQRGTGETHFLRACTDECGSGLSCRGGACTRTCDGDDACTDLAADATCEAPLEGPADAEVERACDVVCARDGDCGALGPDFACVAGRCRSEAGADPGTPDAAAPGCPPGCVAVRGYGEDPGRGCIDRARLELLGCDCNPAAAFPHCGRRTSDDTLWVLQAGELTAESGIAQCTPQESERVTYSCEFAACEVPPLSICTLQATCGDRGCDNLQYDAQGCRRPQCTGDAECDGDQRCVVFSCISDSWCTPANPGPDEACGCSGPAACRVGGACNPVETAGPRGAWQSLELAASYFDLCADCNEIRTVDPSGSIVVKPMATTETYTAMLSQQDLTELTQLIDGPTLRLGARDGFECGFDVTDISVDMRLELPDTTLMQSVANCIYGDPPAEHELKRLHELLWAY